MSNAQARAAVSAPPADLAEAQTNWRAYPYGRRIDRLALALALCAVPISIAVAESLLAVAFIARLIRVAQGAAPFRLPRVFWFWLAWAGLEVVAWSFSPEPKAGWSEMRHLLLIATLFFVLPALEGAAFGLAVWQGIFLTSTLCSLFLIGDFLVRLVIFRRELGVDPDPSLYLRTGGLLNNWMVYGSVEILVVAALVSFWHLYPEKRRRWLPVFAIHALAVLLSLTRMMWVTCWLLLGIDLAWRRSKWLWALPVLPLAIYTFSPGVIRARLRESLRPDHYSNLERVEMLRVGWKMLREHPLTGVGPGRVNRLYRSYLSPNDPVPAYHGHLHNNLVQLAAEFGLPPVLAGLALVLALFHDLGRAWKKAPNQETRFVCLAAFLALGGFMISGLFDYTYGHSLALILLSFSVLTPLFPSARLPAEPIEAG